MKQLVEDKALQKKIDIRKYVSAEVGMPTLTDIMAELDKPGLDPDIPKSALPPHHRLLFFLPLRHLAHLPVPDNCPLRSELSLFLCI